jgi:hypothetical protein
MLDPTIDLVNAADFVRRSFTRRRPSWAYSGVRGASGYHRSMKDLTRQLV